MQVLPAEDEPLVRETLELVHREEGLDVSRPVGGRAAMHGLAAPPADVVLSAARSA